MESKEGRECENSGFHWFTSLFARSPGACDGSSVVSENVEREFDLRVKSALSLDPQVPLKVSTVAMADWTSQCESHYPPDCALRSKN